MLAERRIARALELPAESHDATAELAARRVAGRIAAAEGDGAKVREHFDRALALATSFDSATDTGRVAFDYAQALEDLGDPTNALILYRQAYRARQAARPYRSGPFGHFFGVYPLRSSGRVMMR